MDIKKLNLDHKTFNIIIFVVHTLVIQENVTIDIIIIFINYIFEILLESLQN